MAKKEKKPKKEKQPKGAKGKKGRKAKATEEPVIPYAGSDRVKSALAVMVAVLCGVCIGLSLYTVSYFSRSAREASAAAVEAERVRSATPSANGVILFSQPDGTFIYG